MTEIVNLRHARKAKARSEAAAVADANRRKHGQTKAEKTLRRTDEQRVSKALDGHKLDGKDV